MGVTLDFDHIVIAAETLAEGAAFVEAKLGVAIAPGGRHAVMGTHNRLLSLGKAYLEVIAIDPDAPKPPHARWYGLDTFQGPPRITNWAARTDDLTGALALAPTGSGAPMEVTRGDLSWTMAVPADGQLPFDNAFPALIQWHGGSHPAQRLPDQNCRMSAFQISAPGPQALRAALNAYDGDLESHVADWSGTRISVTLSTPTGPITLQ